MIRIGVGRDFGQPSDYWPPPLGQASVVGPSPSHYRFIGGRSGRVVVVSRLRRTTLQAFAGGILAYIALRIGAKVAEYVESLARWETLGLFLRDSVPTTAVFAGVFL